MRLLHLVSPECNLERERGLPVLLEKIPRARAIQIVAALGGGPASRLRSYGLPVRRLSGPRPSHLACVPGLRQLHGRESIELVHAWDGLAGATARAAHPGLPVALSVDDPADAARVGRWWRSSESRSPDALLCPTEIVRRRLIEYAVPPERVVVIRPGVDFGLINRVDRPGVRSRLRLDGKGPVLVTPGPAADGAGQREVVWATALLQQMWPNIRVLLPGRSREQQRMIRFVRSFRQPQILVCTGDAYAGWELLCCADFCISGAQRDVSTTLLAWAMAAGVPIVAPAVHAITELIADHHNGLLCKTGLPRLLAARVMMMLDDAALARRLAETARGQAFDVFGMRRFVDQHLRLYDNLLSGRPAASGITDSAILT